MKVAENPYDIDETTPLPLYLQRISDRSRHLPNSVDFWDLKDDVFVGSSKVAYIIEPPGVFHYRDCERVFKDTNRIGDFDEDISCFAIRGILYESVAAYAYAEKTGTYLYTIGFVPSETSPYMGASPDRITNTGIIVEIKVPVGTSSEIKEKASDVKKHCLNYWHQCQMQMYILGLNKTHLVFYIFRDRSVVIAEIDRDETWWDRSKERINAFIQRVLEYRRQNPTWKNNLKYLAYKQREREEIEKARAISLNQNTSF